MYAFVERGGVVFIPGQEQPAQPGQISAVLKEWDAMLAATRKPTKEQCAIERQQFEAMLEAGTGRAVRDMQHVTVDMRGMPVNNELLPATCAQRCFCVTC